MRCRGACPSWNRTMAGRPSLPSQAYIERWIQTGICCTCMHACMVWVCCKRWTLFGVSLDLNSSCWVVLCNALVSICTCAVAVWWCTFFNYFPTWLYTIQWSAAAGSKWLKAEQECVLQLQWTFLCTGYDKVEGQLLWQHKGFPIYAVTTPACHRLFSIHWTEALFICCTNHE